MSYIESLSGRLTHGPLLDGKGESRVGAARPFGDEPKLAGPPADFAAPKEPMTSTYGVVGRIQHALTGEA